MWSFVTGLLSSAALFHSYILYPWHMRRAARHQEDFEPLESFPEVVILMAARNEEKHIRPKVVSVFRSSYPKAKIKFYVGTDACTDQTDPILEELTTVYPGLRHRRFEARTGKPGIIQALYEELCLENPEDAILVLTDADTLLEEKTLAELVLPFGETNVGGVQARILAIQPDQTQATKVSAPEIQYLEREMITKQGESKQGCVMGGYGALMALRCSDYEKVPEGFIVDDFYWFAAILRKGRRVVFAPNAVARMPIEGDAAVQFRRKRRLGKGNLQNLWAFRALALNPRLAYAWISHKAIRWLSPWLLLVTVLSWGWALSGNAWGLALVLLGGIEFTALLFLIQRNRRTPAVWAQRLGAPLHFLHMNLALALGAWDLLWEKLRGRQARVWWDNQKP